LQAQLGAALDEVDAIVKELFSASNADAPSKTIYVLDAPPEPYF